MAKKLLRVFRDRQLIPQEAASDDNVRSQITAEFPPVSRHAPTRSSLSELLKKSIRESGRSTEDIASEAEVSPVLLKHFLAGERDIHMVTADKLVTSLGLDVTVE